jgi:hypothetical protein
MRVTLSSGEPPTVEVKNQRAAAASDWSGDGRSLSKSAPWAATERFVNYAAVLDGSGSRPWICAQRLASVRFATSSFR